MQKKIIVDVAKLIHKLWNEYDGELTQKQWIKKESQNIIELFKVKILNDVEINHSEEMSLKLNEKEISIIFEWREKENINCWVTEVEQDIRNINNHVWNIGLTAHYAA